MVSLGDGIGNLNKQSTNLIELTEKRIKNERASLEQVWSQVNILIETIDRNEQKINLELQKLGDRFSHSASNLNQSTQSIEKVLTELQNSAQSMISLGDGIGNLNKQSTNLIELTEKRIKNERASLEQVWSQVNILIETIDRNEQKINLELQKLGDHFVSNAEKQLVNNSKETQKLIEKFENHLKIKWTI
jgi:methyl-accepting chemotaxis protein